MKTVLLLIALLTAGPAWAVPLTFDFTGNSTWESTTYVTVTGSFTYESEASPSAYNVHNLTPNVTYQLSSWDFTVTTDYTSIPTLTQFSGVTTFSNTLAGDTSEFCIGKCIFSSNPYERLLFSNGEQTLQLTFTLPSFAQMNAGAPDTLAEWGPLNASTATLGGASWLKLYDDNGTRQIMALLTDGGITGLTVGAATPVQSVPETSSVILCLIGFAMVGWFIHKRRVS